MDPIWGLFKIFMEQLWGLHMQKVGIYGAILRSFKLADFTYKNQFFSTIVFIVYVSNPPE